MHLVTNSLAMLDGTQVMDFAAFGYMSVYKPCILYDALVHVLYAK